MTAMMSGEQTNSGVVGLAASTEFDDFNGDGDGPCVTTLIEQAKPRGMRAGVVSTARVTHAAPRLYFLMVEAHHEEGHDDSH